MSESRTEERAEAPLLPPIEHSQEVWAAGVTYSALARGTHGGSWNEKRRSETQSVSFDRSRSARKVGRAALSFSRSADSLERMISAREATGTSRPPVPWRSGNTHAMGREAIDCARQRICVRPGRIFHVQAGLQKTLRANAGRGIQGQCCSALGAILGLGHGKHVSSGRRATPSDGDQDDGDSFFRRNSQVQGDVEIANLVIDLIR